MKMKWILKSLTTASILLGPISLLSCTNSNPLSSNFLNQSVDIFIKGPRKLDVGTTYQYTAEIKSSMNDDTVIWSLSNPNAGTITEDGQFTPSAIGNVSIIATLNSDPSVCSTFQVKVKSPAPTSITIEGPDQVVVGTTANYKVAVEPQFADDNVLWKSSAPSIASISPNGDMKTYGTGDVTVIAISAVDDSIQGTKAVKIIDAKPESITIVGPGELNANETKTYDVSLKPEKAYKQIRWSFDNPNIATVSDTGEVTTYNESGQGTLTAEALFFEDGEEIVAATATLQITVGLYHDVTMSHTIGTGFTMASHRIAHGQTHRLRFISSTFQIGDKDFPTHKCLKKSDVEVVYDGDNIMNDCSLSNNELTIPAKYCDKDIKVNVLGGEISDVITWPILTSISDADAFSLPEVRQAKKCFQVGDYKNVTHKGSVVNWARIIDFDHDEYLAMNPSTQVKEKTKADFSFEFQKPITYDGWNSDPDYSTRTCQYHEEGSVLHPFVVLDFECDSLFERDEDTDIIINSNVRECFISMPEQVSSNNERKMNTFLNYFWPMSLFESMGLEPPEENQDTIYAGPEGERYTYYYDNGDEGYQSLKSWKQRLASKDIDTDKSEENWYYLRTTGKQRGVYSSIGHVYFVNNVNGEKECSTYDALDFAFCPVFAI